MSIFKTLRSTILIAGVIALIAGIVLLIWPIKSAVVVTSIFATYLIIAGVVYAGLGLFAAGKRGWARIGYIALGLLYIIAGIVAFANLGVTTAMLATMVVVFIGVSWIVDGVVSLSLLGQDASRVWTLLYAILSIIAGVSVLFNVLAAGVFLWIFLGVSLLVLGIVQIVRAITMSKDAAAKLS